MPSMRSGVSVSRSTNDAACPAARTAATSSAFASRIAACDWRSAAAMAIEGCILLVGGRERQLCRGRTRARADVEHQPLDVAGVDAFWTVHVRSVRLSAMSSRWISSARPAWPRMAAMSPDFLPMIAAASSLG